MAKNVDLKFCAIEKRDSINIWKKNKEKGRREDKYDIKIHISAKLFQQQSLVIFTLNPFYLKNVLNPMDCFSWKTFGEKKN